MRLAKLTGVLLLLWLGTTASGQELIYTLMVPTEAVTPGGKVRVEVVLLNPAMETADFDLPAAISARLSTGTQCWSAELRSEGAGSGQVTPHGYAYNAYTFTMPIDARGEVMLELNQPVRLRGVLDAAESAATVKPTEIAKTPLSHIIATQPAASAVKRTFAGRIGLHEPIYFIYGSKAPAAKFQFSFKYRLLGDKARLNETLPMLRGLYFGYTQRSLWDIQGDSSPFYDTSYMPELIIESQSLIDPKSDAAGKWLGYQVALKHESNGKSGIDSRSVNIVYARSAFALGRLDSWNLLVIPRVFTYVSDLSNNPDIADYRGNADLVFVVGRNDGPTLSVTGQLGRGWHKGGLQADLNLPIKFDRMFDFATYLLVQYWDGYGEDLLEYNRRTSSLRVGFSLVR